MRFNIRLAPVVTHACISAKQSCVRKHITTQAHNTQAHKKFSQAPRRAHFTNSTNLIPSRQTALSDILNISFAVIGDDHNLPKHCLFSVRVCVSSSSSPSDNPLPLQFLIEVKNSMSFTNSASLLTRSWISCLSGGERDRIHW
jgi:hypothetical protein